MAITGKSRATIAANILADWQAKLNAAGFSSFTISTNPFGILLANALALDLEGIESNAISLGSEIIPSTADATNVTRHAEVDGITIKPASFGQWGITISGPASTTVSLAGRKLVRTNGQMYTPLANFATIGAGGSLEIAVEADTAGTAPNFTTDETLTWTSAPTGCSPTATVNTASVLTTAGQDPDDTGDTAQNVREYRQGRPASGSPPDWIAKAKTIAKVKHAYCYPCLRPNPGAFTAATDLDQLGCTTVVVLGPPQGDSPTPTVVVGGVAGVQPTDVRGYFLGTYDKDGNSTGTDGAVYGGGPPLYPAAMDPASFSIETPSFTNTDVDVTITLEASSAFPSNFGGGSLIVDASSTANSLVVTGDRRVQAGAMALVNVGTANIRGAYQLVKLPPDPTYNGGTNKTTFDMTHSTTGVLLGVPTGNVYPAPGNWSAMRTAIFDLFDSLGPGDVPTAAATPVTAYAVRRRTRWPRQSTLGPADIYQARIATTLLDVAGTLTAVVNTPATDLIADPKQLFWLGTFLAHA